MMLGSRSLRKYIWFLDIQTCVVELMVWHQLCVFSLNLIHTIKIHFYYVLMDNIVNIFVSGVVAFSLLIK